uniref:Uncharacterized protein n=1 Tax=Schistocephalus solidus TaxID=70667 RepID=A0A0X3QB43_SCHSO
MKKRRKYYVSPSASPALTFSFVDLGMPVFFRPLSDLFDCNHPTPPCPAFPNAPFFFEIRSKNFFYICIMRPLTAMWEIFFSNDASSKLPRLTPFSGLSLRPSSSLSYF